MSRKIQILRGELKDLPLLDVGELAWVMDAQKLFVGNGEENIDLTTVSIDTEELLKNEELSNLIRSMGVSLKPDVETFSKLPANDAESTVRYVAEHNQSYIRKDGSWVPFAKVIGAEHLERLVSQQPINPNLLEKSDTSKPENVEGWLPWPSSSKITQHQGTKFFKIENKTGNNLGMSTTRTYDVVAGDKLTVSFYAALSNVDESWNHMYWLDPSGLLTVENVDITDTGQRLEGLPVKRYVLKLKPASSSSSNRRFLIGSWKQQRGVDATMYISEPKLEHGISATPFSLHQNDIYNKLDQLENEVVSENLLKNNLNIGWRGSVTQRTVSGGYSYRHQLLHLETGTYTLSGSKDIEVLQTRIDPKSGVTATDGTELVNWLKLPMSFKVTSPQTFVINIRINSNGVTPIDAELNTIQDFGLKLERGVKASKFSLNTVETGRLLRDVQNNSPLNVVSYGADPTGTIDASPIIQKLADIARDEGGGTIYLPAGTFLLGTTIQLYSNTKVIGEQGQTIVKSGGSNAKTAFRTQGSVGEEINLTPNREVQGMNYIVVASGDEKKFSVDDDVLLHSQRNALSEDAGSWRMGEGTAGIPATYFGEFHVVADTSTPSRLYFAGPILFPGYRIDSKEETSVNSRKRATVRKVNFVKNVVIDGLSFSGPFTQAIIFEFTKDSIVKNLFWEGDGDASFVEFQRSLKCEAFKCVKYFTHSTQPRDHYTRNTFKTVSCVHCGFRECEDHNGTQPVDFTFTGAWFVDQFSYMTDCKIYYPSYNSATSHGGTYACRFDGNLMTGCARSGLSVRTRSATVVNNIIAGPSTGLSAYGICIYQGSAQDVIVSNNQVLGFGVGVMFVDSRNDSIKYMGTVIHGNVFDRINVAIELKRSTVTTGQGSYISIADNLAKRFYSSNALFIKSGSYYNSVDVKNNTVIGNGSTSFAVQADTNCADWRFSGNRFENTGSYPLDFGAINSSLLDWAEGNVSVDTSNNFPYQANSTTIQRQFVHGSMIPSKNDTYILGQSTRKWRNVHSTLGVSTTSDRNLKENIENLDFGLELLEKIKPKQYNLKGEPGTHYGVIAQDIEDLFNSAGVETKDLAMLDVDVDEDTGDKRYGLNYSELIPILIKSIQELQDEIRKIK